MHGPTVDGPSRFLNDLRPAVLVHPALALLLGRLHPPTNGPGVAATARHGAIVYHRDDAWLRQIKHAPGDDFMARRAIAFFQVQELVLHGRRIVPKPAA